MALDASSSLGAAIGLAGTPTDKTDKFYEMGIKADMAKAKADAAKAAKEDKAAAERDRLMKLWKIDPKKYLPERNEEIREKLADYTLTLQEYTRRGEDPAASPEFIKKNAELMLFLGGAEQEFEAVKSDTDFYTKNATKFKKNDNLNPERFQKGSQFYKTGDGIESTVSWTDIAAETAPKVGVSRIETPNGNGTSTVLQTVPEKNLYYAETFISKGLPGVNGEPPQDWVAANFIKETKDILNQNAAYRELEDKDPNKNKMLLDTLKDRYVKALEAGQKREEGITQRAQTNVNINMGGGDDTGKAVGTGKKTFSVNYKTTAGGVKTGDATSIDGATFKEAEVKATLPKDAIDMNTGERLVTVGSQKIKGGEIQLVYTYADGTESPEGIILSGNILPDQNVTEGQLKSGKVVPKLVFLGEIIQTNSQGKESVTPFYSSADAILKNFDVISTSGDKNKDYILKQYNKLKEREKEETDKLGVKPTQAQPKAQGGQTKKIKVGDVVNGYRFKGGDTKDSKNWEKI
jgi:hypothetical protein